MGSRMGAMMGIPRLPAKPIHVRGNSLVHRLLNPLGFAVGQLAVFQGGPSRTGGKAPLSVVTSRTIFVSAEETRSERKMVRDAPSSRLADDPF